MHSEHNPGQYALIRTHTVKKNFDMHSEHNPGQYALIRTHTVKKEL